MLKNILKLEGVKKLSIQEEKKIYAKGGNFEFCYCASLGYVVDCASYDQICPLDN